MCHLNLQNRVILCSSRNEQTKKKKFPNLYSLYTLTHYNHSGFNHVQLCSSFMNKLCSFVCPLSPHLFTDATVLLLACYLGCSPIIKVRPMLLPHTFQTVTIVKLLSVINQLLNFSLFMNIHALEHVWSL